MAKYEVISPWHGVKRGDVVEMETLHPVLASNVRLLEGEIAEALTPSTPGAGTGEVDKKAIIKAKLTELGIEFKGNLGVEKLAELLPEGELEKLFPTE